jgi:hypothetical protein
MVNFRGRIRRWKEDKLGGLAAIVVAGGGCCVGVSRAAMQVTEGDEVTCGWSVYKSLGVTVISAGASFVE